MNSHVPQPTTHHPADNEPDPHQIAENPAQFYQRAPLEPSTLPSDELRIDRMRAAGVPEDLFEVMGAHGVGPLVTRMGIEFHHMAADLMIASVPVSGNEQNTGLFHGGAHFVMAETLGSLSAVLHVRLTLGTEQNVVGTELSATHHRGTTSGLVWATCRPLNLGRQLTSHEIVMRDDAGRRLSTARMTNMILPAR